MRYLGNKDAIIQDIIDLLDEKKLTDKGLSFFDAFAGTGAVSDAVKERFNVQINDILEWSSIYTKGRVYASKVTFDKLEINPFELFNQENEIEEGFFYNTYSPGGSDRMYFSENNAGRIDWIRTTIERWQNEGRLNEGEYEYLLASLIESMSKVANTAGVYGAFLKHWDGRALKQMEFISVPYTDAKEINDVTFYNGKVEEIISDIQTDVLYLDPPYTQNQYGTQYHIFETLVKMDSPEVSPITGSRPTAPMRSDWSKDIKAHILFDKVLHDTTAKYVILSYSDDGIMSKSFIEASMKRYGKPETYQLTKINYKKYQNFKTTKSGDHFEYLFYIEMKDKADIRYESPLNYIGSKAKMINDIVENMPNGVTRVYDVFGGGFNVGVNMATENVEYNDANFKVVELIKMFRDYDTYSLIQYFKRQIKKYGLEPANKDAYQNARAAYNSLPAQKQDSRILYTLIMYGFQQQIRFNSKLEFNNPVGMRWMNDKVLEKIISFSRRIKTLDVEFNSSDFNALDIEDGPNNFLYLDPPYRLTLGSYNDGKRGFSGWSIDYETKLLEFMQQRHEAGNRIMMSYVLEHGELENKQLKQWLDSSDDFYYIAVEGIKGRGRSEILVMNYER